MDLSQIEDVNQIKAMAYDQIVIIETAQKNMQMINERLTQLQEEPKEEAPTDKK